MMKLMYSLLLPLTALAQWSDFASFTSSSDLYGFMNGKPTFQIVSGPPTSLAGTAGKDLAYDSAGHQWYGATVTGTPATWTALGGGSGSPGGSNTQIQVNASGNFAGYSALTFDTTTLTIPQTSSLVLNPTVGNDSNDRRGFDFTCGADSLNSDPTFSDENCMKVTEILTNGFYSYGGGTNAKTTSSALFVDGEYRGSAQAFPLQIRSNKYSMGDSGAYNITANYWGGPVNGDECQGYVCVTPLAQFAALNGATGALQTATVTSVTRSACTGGITTGQIITANKTAQAVLVSSTSGCVNGDWVIIAQATPSNGPNIDAVQIISHDSTHITGIYHNNQSSGVTVTPALVLGVDQTVAFGQGRLMVDLSGATYSTGHVTTTSGGGIDFSGTSLTNSIVGGSSTNIGAIAFTADDMTVGPWAAGNTLKSWFGITQVTSGTHLVVLSNTVAGDTSYRGFAPNSGGLYIIRPSARILFIADIFTLVCETSTATWTVGDTVLNAGNTYPDVTGFEYHLASWTPGGSYRGFEYVINQGARKYDVGYFLAANMTTGGNSDATGWGIGFQASSIETGFVSGAATSGEAFEAVGDVTASAASQRPCFSFRGGNAGGFANPGGDGICEDTSQANPPMWFNNSNTHVVTIQNSLFELTSAPQNLNGGISACNSGSLGAMQTFTNSSVTTWGSTLAGGGSTTVLGFCNGTNWTAMAK